MEISILTGTPFVFFLLLLILDKRVSGLAGLMGVVATAVGLVVSCMLFSKPLSVQMPWIRAAGFGIDLSLETGALSSVMLPLVHGIALLVQGYSIAYMKGDRNLSRYFAFIQLFLFSMIGIVLAGNLVVSYLFWELVGLSSYLLIGFWNHKPRTVWAAQKAFIMNRIGDAAFLCGILLLICHTGNVQFSVLPAAVQEVEEGRLTLIGLLLFGGCVGKSAQFPLSAWLPDAMEGPTPVSALIHAATMVAAGIFLMARIAFMLTPFAGAVIAVVGLITMVDGALRACSAWDIKRVLAYSTQSQLGLMVFAIGAGAWQMAFFHLVTHAFFKAGLFLSAGSVIHAVTPGGNTRTDFDPQDMRTMGALRSKLPITFICYMICAAALAGLPFFSGFLSKDAIFLAALGKVSEWGVFAYAALAISMFSAGLTAFYMTRQLWLVFWGNARYDQSSVVPHESGVVMWLPMMILAFLSSFVVFSLNPFDAASGWMMKRFEVSGNAHSWVVPLISVILSGIAVFLALRRAQAPGGFGIGRDVKPLLPGLSILRDYREEKRFTVFFLAPFQFLASGLKFLELFVVDAIVRGTGALLIGFSKVINWTDKTVVDGLVSLVSRIAHSAGKLVGKLQSGRIQSYYLATFISLILLVIWLVAGK